MCPDTEAYEDEIAGLTDALQAADRDTRRAGRARNPDCPTDCWPNKFWCRASYWPKDLPYQPRNRTTVEAACPGFKPAARLPLTLPLKVEAQYA